MQNLTSCRTVSGGLIICLMLASPSFFCAQTTKSCPAYPRAMDQVYVCLETTQHPGNPGTDHTYSYELTLDQNINLHNPVRFTFPTLPYDFNLNVIEATFDFGDGNGPVAISSEEIKTISYPAPGQYTLNWTIRCLGNSCAKLDYSGSITFQNNFNNTDANYNDFLPDETWGDMNW